MNYTSTMYADEDTFVNNVRQVFSRFRKHKIIVNPKKTELGLEEVEYIGHLVSHKGVSFTKEKRQKIQDFCDSTVRTVDRYTIDRYTVDRYTLYILHCLTVHTHTLSTPHIYCTLYVLCTLSVHLSQTSLLFATHVHILEHSYSHTCSLSVHPCLILKHCLVYTLLAVPQYAYSAEPSECDQRPLIKIIINRLLQSIEVS